MIKTSRRQETGGKSSRRFLFYTYTFTCFSIPLPLPLPLPAFLVSLPRAARRGFSIIELVVVMAIIAVLAGVAIPNFRQARERAKIQVSKTFVKQMSSAIEFYSNDNLRFHPIVTTSPPFNYPDFSASCSLDSMYKELSLYVKENPKDVLGGNGWCSYSINADRTSYTLTVKASDSQQTLITAIRSGGANYKSISAVYQGEDVP